VVAPGLKDRRMAAMSDTVPIEIDPPMTAVTVMRDLVRMLEYIVRLKNYTSQGPHGLTPEHRARVIRRNERELVIVREILAREEARA
jgi:hypothetical protein